MLIVMLKLHGVMLNFFDDMPCTLKAITEMPCV